MPDFHQSGAITTLHRLGGPGVERLERELLQYNRSRPVALVLPCLFSEIRGPALKGIIDVLTGVPYLQQVVVSLSGPGDREDYEAMREAFAGVRTIERAPATLLWSAGARIQALYRRLRDE